MRQDATPQRLKRSRADSTSDQSASVSAQKRRKLLHPTTAAPSARKSNGALSAPKIATDTRRSSKPAADIYEVPDSDEENVEPIRRADDAADAPVANGHDGDAYDIPESDDEAQEEPQTPPGRKRGRPMNGTTDSSNKASPQKASKQRSTNAPVTSVERGSETPSAAAEDGMSVRSSGRRRKPTSKAIEGKDFLKRARQDVSASRSRSTSVVNGTPQATRFHEAKVPTPLKSILSPTKRDGDRRRKSVVFGDIDGTKTPGKLFQNVTPKGDAKKLTSGRTALKAQPPPEEPELVEQEPGQEAGPDDAEEEKEEEEEEEEEETCAKCSKPDSRKGNQIIFCDGCDLAVHQKCYNVVDIPEGDWYCDKCSKEREAKAAAAASIPNVETHLRGLQRVLLDRCTGRRRVKLVDQEEAYDKAHQLVEQTVLAGEGNSMLVIGARGSGKTTLVETIIDELAREHRQIFHVVRLNGFIHTDDKLALKEIWRQLGKEMDVDEDATSKSNYADTMASLLALLSHPSEIASAEEGVTSKAVVFVIDEFDMFAAHARQTLLYNLFDIAQARKAPIAVLGCTTRMDVVEMLEKRVKSRFSHRYVFLSQPKSLPAYWQICKQGLAVDDQDMASEGIDVNLKGHGEFMATWNGMIEELYKDKSFQNMLRCHYFTSKSVASFLSACILPLSSLRPGALNLEIPGTAGMDSVEMSAPNSKLHLLPSLSELDIGLLIAAARLDIVAHTDTVNFAMAYDEYGSLMGRQRVQSSTAGMLALGGGVRVWGRGVAGVAWERLIALGLLLPAGIGGRGGPGGGHGGLEGRMWKVDVALEDIPAGARLNQVLARWCKEI